jgi:hypothetical protein
MVNNPQGKGTMSDSRQASDSRADKAIERGQYAIQFENLERKTVVIAKDLTAVHQKISIYRGGESPVPGFASSYDRQISLRRSSFKDAFHLLQ